MEDKKKKKQEDKKKKEAAQKKVCLWLVILLSWLNWLFLLVCLV